MLNAFFESTRLSGNGSGLQVANFNTGEFEVSEAPAAITLRVQDGLVARRQQPTEPSPQLPQDKPSDLPNFEVVDRPNDNPPTKSPFDDGD